MSGGRFLPATLLRLPRDPTVAFRILFRAGSADDHSGREGLAALTGALLVEGGTRRLTYPELMDALFPMAGQIGVQVDREVTVLTGRVHRDHLDSFWDLLRQVVVEPRFDAAAFTRLKSDQSNDLVTRLRTSDDEALGKEVLQVELYPGHPYGHPVSGTVRGLAAIRLEDVEEFRRRRLTRERCEVGIAGGFPESFPSRALASLSELPGGGEPPVELPPGRPVGGTVVTLVVKPTQAAAISLGFPLGVSRADDDWYPLAVANSHLGEHRTFNGVLMRHMRSDRGLNYGDYSYVESFVQDGSSTFALPNIPRRRQCFSIWIRPVALRHAHFALRQALREFRKLGEEGLTAAEFETARSFLLHYSRLWTQTSSRRLGYEMDGRFYGRRSLVDEFQDRLPQMTVDEVNEAVRRHFRPPGLHAVVVIDAGSAPALAEAIAGDAPSPIVYETETRPDVLEEDRAISAWPLGVPASSVRIVEAADLFDR